MSPWIRSSFSCLVCFGFPSISSREASIGEQARAGDVAGFGAGKVSDEAGDLVGIAIALEGCYGNKCLREVAVRRIHVGINRARLDIIDRDSTRPQVASQSLREAGNGSLGERIDRTANERHTLAIGAADMNDATALA